jgi:GDP-D-mannose 3',5'-epimerase
MAELSGKRVLVTGGAGMIGSNLVKRLVSLGCSVAVADNLWRGQIQNLYSSDGNAVIDLNRDFYQLDLRIAGALDETISQFDYVYHLADVVAGIGYVFNNQGSIFRDNLLINSNVISSVRAHSHVKGFVYVGTACSFPASKQTGVDAAPLVEEDQYPAAPERSACRSCTTFTGPRAPSMKERPKSYRL